MRAGSRVCCLKGTPKSWSTQERWCCCLRSSNWLKTWRIKCMFGFFNLIWSTFKHRNTASGLSRCGHDITYNQIHFFPFRLVFSQSLISLDLIEAFLKASHHARHSSSVKGILAKVNMNSFRKCFPWRFFSFDFCASWFSQQAAGLKTLTTTVLMVPPLLGYGRNGQMSSVMLPMSGMDYFYFNLFVLITLE